MVHHGGGSNFQKRCVDASCFAPEEELPLKLESIPNTPLHLLAKRRGNEGLVQHYGITMGKRSRHSTAEPVFGILHLAEVFVKATHPLIEGSADQGASRSRDRRPPKVCLGRCRWFAHSIGTTMKFGLRGMSLALKNKSIDDTRIRSGGG